MTDNGVFRFSVAFQDAGSRLDAFAASHLPDCSRSFAALLIRSGRITVDGQKRKPGYRVKTNERLQAVLPEPQPLDLAAEPMALELLYEDEYMIVVNKPAGLVVHPAAGHSSGTLVNGLLHHCPDLEGIGGEQRPGIVHRLDKDTSGAIVVAKTTVAHHGLSHQFKERKVQKKYLALVHGVPVQNSGSIDLPVGRHPVDRKKMSTVNRSGREALTLWRVREQFPRSALLDVDLKTGRTHQIRVHCQSMGHPLVGDPVYGSAKILSRLSKTNADVHRILRQAPRQMLHAARLAFTHPVTENALTFDAPMPPDINNVLSQLRGCNDTDKKRRS